jgi:AcrR family transcriptional regulator
MSTPHDALFKSVFSNPEHARGALQAVDVLRDAARAPQGLKALEQVLRYILEVNDEHLAAEQLKALLEREIGPEAKDTIVTAAQRYIEQGRQEAKSEVLLRLLRRRFGGAVNDEIERRIAAGSAEQIDTWTDRVISAATLAELFTD